MQMISRLPKFTWPLAAVTFSCGGAAPSQSTEPENSQTASVSEPSEPAAASAGLSCENEIARECPDGQVDACLATPPAAATHICVVTP